jgi:hypothetical protein
MAKQSFDWTMPPCVIGICWLVWWGLLRPKKGDS